MRTLTICLCLVLAAGSVLAGKEASITRIDDIVLQTLDPGSTRCQTCSVGNLDGPCFACVGWIAGGEVYKYLFAPGDECAVCPYGFRPTAVHVVLGFNVSMVPQSFPVFAGLAAAAWSDDAGCWIPGAESCVGAATTVDITAVGTYEIVIPIADCPCSPTAPANADPYFFSIHFPGALDANFYLDSSGGESCLAYNDWGEGWYDMNNVTGSTGDIVMWADLECCNEQIPAEPLGWGTIKSLYR